MKNIKIIPLMIVMLCLSLSSQLLSKQMSGTYHIGGPSKDFSSFTDAIDSLNMNGINGPVVFEVADGVYQEQLFFNTIKGTSRTNTITFQGHLGDSSKVIIADSTSGSMAFPAYLIDINLAEYLYFKEITFFKGYGGTYDYLMNIDSSSHLTFDKCQFIGPNDGAPRLSGLITHSNYNSNYNVFKNNYLKNGAFYCIRWQSSGSEKGNVFTGNIIDSIRTVGIITFYQDSLTITNNKIDIMGTSIYVFETGKANFKGNINIVANNDMVLRDDGLFGQFTFWDVDNILIAHNTLEVFSRGTTQGFSLGSTSTTPVKTKNIKIQNNSFISHSKGINSCVMYFYNMSFTVESNNNLYGAGKKLVIYNGTDYFKLSDWKTTGYGTNDISVDVTAFSNKNLKNQHPHLNGKATPLTNVLSDINGNVRDLTSPDIGAYEFTPPVLNPIVFAIAKPTLGFCAGNKDIYVTLLNGGTNTLTSTSLAWSINRTAQTPYFWTGSLLSGDSLTIKIGNTTFASGTSYLIKAYPSVGNGTTITPNPINSDSVKLIPGISGTYTIDPAGSGASNYASFRAATTDLNIKGLCGPVVFNIADGYYNECVEIGKIPGASATNTVVFQSRSLNASKVILDTAWAATGSHTLKLNRSNYVTFRHLTITNSSALFLRNSYVIELSNGAGHNIFENNIVFAQVNNSGSYSSVIGNDQYTSEEFNIIRNNKIYGGDVSIFLSGAGFGLEEKGNVIHNNTTDSASYSGIYMELQDSLTISNNKVFPMNSALFGIYLFGIHINYNTNDSSFIINNFVTTQNPAGVALFSGFMSLANFYNNSFISSSDTGSYYATAFFQINISDVRLINNIFVNDAGGRTIFSYINGVNYTENNAFYTKGALMGTWDFTPCPALSDWKTSSSMDKNSVFTDPMFNSPSTNDLHLTKNSTGVIGKGVFMHNASRDIDNYLRPIKNPDIGADQTRKDSNDIGATMINQSSTQYLWKIKYQYCCSDKKRRIQGCFLI